MAIGPVLLEEKRKPREFVEKLKLYYHKAKDFLEDNFPDMLAGAFNWVWTRISSQRVGLLRHIFSESLVEILAGVVFMVTSGPQSVHFSACFHLFFIRYLHLCSLEFVPSKHFI